MDAFDRLGTICLVLTCIVVAPFLILMRHDFLLVGLLDVAAIPLFWIAGLNIMEFLTKPFNEKGVKGVFSWVIAIVMALVIYAIFAVALRYMMKFLMLM